MHREPFPGRNSFFKVEREQMESIKKIFSEKYVVWFAAIVCIFQMVLSVVHYFLPVKNLYSLDYTLIFVALIAWIIHLVAYRVRPHLGWGFIILAGIFLWYLISCQIMSDTYYRDWFSFNKDPIIDTLLLIGLVFPMGIYIARKGYDKLIRIIIHILIFVWTGFMVYVLINVFQNKIINTPSGGQIGMSRNIALCLNTHYNTTGVIELVMLIIVLYFIFTSSSRALRIAYILPCLVHLVTLIMANSRTAFVAGVIFFSASVFSAVYNAKWEISLLRRILFGAGAAVITAVILLLFRELVFSVHESITHLRELINGTFVETSSARDLTSMMTMRSRFLIWKSSLHAMVIDANRFLFGVTPASVTSAITEASAGQFENLYTHNQFLEFGVALGVPGMLMFTLFVMLLAKKSFMISIKQNEGLNAWIVVSIVVTLLIANLSEATLMFYRFASSYPFFLFCGWVYSKADLQTEKNKQVFQKKNVRKKGHSA